VIIIGDVEDIVENLKDKPYPIYYLYNHYNTGFEFKLPSFIDRIREVNYLRDLGLLEFYSHESKHLHLKPTKFTNNGIIVYNLLEQMGILTIFNDIPLDSSNSFKAHYYNKLNEISKEIQLLESHFYKLLVKNIGGIGRWLNRGKSRIKVIKFELKEKTELIEICKLDYEFYCLTCKQFVEQDIEIIFNLDNFDRNPRLIECRVCGSPYHLCPIFECFYPLK